MTSTYTPLWDWVMEDPDLTGTEALVVCRVLRWREGGCFESNTTLGRKLKLDPRTVQRTVKRLVKREWLAVCYFSKRNRIIYVNPKRLAAGPLFERIGIEVMKKMVAYGTTP